ncbi:MAG: endonuclease/exonuclease/phosphatase family protein [Ruminococcaceae bacterium]|nr:endonuclease/exonuclease/phosphatase family protein [Oscillospiraceae bacterium]
MKNKGKKGRILKKILVTFVCVVLVLVLGFGTADMIYYPQYKKSTASFDVSQNSTQGEITVMSANVRTWSPTDVGKKSWFYRADLIINNIASVKPDIIGFQEVTRMHYSYLTNALKGYDNILQYRDNSKLSEGCPVFYNTARFDLKDKGSFWLSETPDVMSKDWGSVYYRICSYVILVDKSTGKELVVFNTHLDNVSDTARINGINVVLDKIKQFGGLPSIIMGDFNADESSSTYKAATELFLDAKYQTENTDSGATYQGFGRQLERENIDYFMISKQGIKVNEYKIIDTTYDGVYPSDHFSIALKIELT